MDELRSGKGADTLIGGAGADLLYVDRDVGTKADASDSVRSR